MRFNVLGSMEVWIDGQLTTPSAPKVRWTLALLLLRANRIVDTTAIIDELWGDNPPRSAVTTTQTYIYQLRKSFAQASSEVDVDGLILTQAPGYGLRLDREQLDVAEFEHLAAEGSRLLTQGHAEAAADRLRAALALWRGPALADVAVGCHLGAHVAGLEEIRIRTLELRIQADIVLGRGRELLPELRSLVAAHPLNEWMHAQLITMLHAAGRRAEALQAYQVLRRVLDRELGLEPSAMLQKLQRDLLDGVTPLIEPVPAGRRPLAAIA